MPTPDRDVASGHPLVSKFVLGCGIVVGVLGIGALVGGYYFVWKPARSMVGEFAQLQEIPKLNAQVREKAPYTPPADNTLTPDGVDRFRQTQQLIITKLGARAEELATKYQLMEKGRANYKPSWSELMSAYKDFATLIVEAKRAQVEALNQTRFSLAEYAWTRQRIYEAAGVPVNFNLETIIREITEGKEPSATQVKVLAPEEVPEKSRSLVAPHVKELTDRAGLAAFGL